MALAKQAVLDRYMASLVDVDQKRGKKQVDMIKLEVALDTRDAFIRIAEALEAHNKHG